jgi:hypothetical protein
MNAKAIKSIIPVLTFFLSLSAHAWGLGFNNPVSDLKKSVPGSDKSRSLGRVFNEWKACSKVVWTEEEREDTYQGVSISCESNFDKAKSIFKKLASPRGNEQDIPDSIIYRFIYARKGKNGEFRLDKIATLTCWSDKACYEETQDESTTRNTLSEAYQNINGWDTIVDLYEGKSVEGVVLILASLQGFVFMHKSASQF